MASGRRVSAMIEGNAPVKLPIPLITYALREKCVRDLRLFMLMKILDPDAVSRLDKVRVQEYCDLLGLKCTKTAKSSIERLAAKGWISINDDLLYTRSVRNITKRYTGEKGPRTFCERGDIDHFQGFCIAAQVTFMVNRRKFASRNLERRREFERRSEARKRGRVTQSELPFNVNFVSSQMLAKDLAISVSTAHEYKKLAKDSGYLTFGRAFSALPIEVSEVNHYRKYGPHDPNRVIQRKGEVLLRRPDILRSSTIKIVS